LISASFKDLAMTQTWAFPPPQSDDCGAAEVGSASMTSIKGFIFMFINYFLTKRK